MLLNLWERLQAVTELTLHAQTRANAGWNGHGKRAVLTGADGAAPATVIPRELYHRSFNYVSSTDPVNLVDITANGFICGPDSEYVEILKQHRDQVIWLTPHPDAKMIDHDFQSPTFLPEIEKHIREYLNLEIRNY